MSVFRCCLYVAGLLAVIIACGNASPHKDVEQIGCPDLRLTISREELNHVVAATSDPFTYFDGPSPPESRRQLFFFAAVMGLHEQLREWSKEASALERMDPDTLTVTAQVGDLESLKILILAGASPDTSVPGGTTPLMASIWCRKQDVTKYLIEAASADVHLQRHAGTDAMSVAIVAENELAVRMLLEHGYDLTRVRYGRRGLTPSQLAENTGNQRIIELIAAAGRKMAK